MTLSLGPMGRIGMAALPAVFLAAVACSGASSSPEPTPPSALSQRVVYVGPEHAVYTAGPDGTDVRLLLGTGPGVTVGLATSMDGQRSARRLPGSLDQR